jgi:4-hydroxy-tetrahydrodipicolinate synthase
MLKLAEHERIVGVKDAKGSFVDSSQVLRRTDLAYYSGDDANTLPLLSIGGVGLVGTSTHLTGVGAKQLIEAFDRGDLAGALACTGVCCPRSPDQLRADCAEAGVDLPERAAS